MSSSTKLNRDAVIYGGAFDPPTKAHIATIYRLMQKYDHVIIAPCLSPGHKIVRTPYELRVLMLQSSLYYLGCAYGTAYVLVKDVMERLPQETTFHLLEELENAFERECLHFAVGTDHLVNFDTWYNSDVLKERYSFVHLKRSDDSIPEDIKIYDSIELDMPDISSTTVRNLCEEGKYNQLTQYLDSSLAAYLEQSKLYER